MSGNKKREESEEKSVKIDCPVCNISVVKSYLKQHLKLNCGKRKTHPCNICNEKFSNKKVLLCHLKETHKKAKNLKLACDLCLATFCDDRNLRRHVTNIHGEKQHLPCEHCDKKFPNKTYLLRHYYGQHKELKQEPKCEICMKTFVNNIKMKEHVKNVHILERVGNSNALLDQHNTEEKNFSKTKMRDDKVEEEVLQTKFNKEFGPGLFQPSNMKDKNSASVFSNKCNQCNKTFASKKNVIRHKKMVHDNGRKIEKCNKKFYQKRSQNQHIGKVDTFLEDLRKKKSTISNTKNKELCHICDKEFDQDELEIHMLFSHSNEDKMLDVKIEGSIENELSIADPLKIEISDETSIKVELDNSHNPLTLDLDDVLPRAKSIIKKEPGKDYEISQLNQVQEKSKLHCDICTKSFNRNKSLVRHVGLHHPQVAKPYKKRYTRTDSYLMNYSVNDKVCKLCSISISSKHSFKRHYDRCHQEGTEERPYKCDICHKLFLTAGNLYRHKDHVHEKREEHKCDLCEKSYTELRSLRCHKQSEHGDKSDSRQCKICNKTFNAKTYRRHMNEVHEKKKTKKCDLCTKTFSRPKHLEDHVQLEHKKKSTKYKCEICDQQFRDYSGLFYHSNKHTGKSFPCKFCGNDFSSKESHRAHVRAIHQEKKDYKCEICHEQFSFKGTVFKHMELVHGDKSWRVKSHHCSFCDKEYQFKRELEGHFLRIHQMTIKDFSNDSL